MKFPWSLNWSLCFAGRVLWRYFAHWPARIVSYRIRHERLGLGLPNDLPESMNILFYLPGQGFMKKCVLQRPAGHYCVLPVVPLNGLIRAKPV